MQADGAVVGLVLFITIVWPNYQRYNRREYIYFIFGLKNLERKEKIGYIGRPLSSSSATGYHNIHIEELNKFL